MSTQGPAASPGTAPPNLRVHAPPFSRAPVTTPRVMVDVLLALAPATVAAVWFFGLAAALIILAALAGAVVAEWLWAPRSAGPRGATLRDGSALLTGLLLALTLPPTTPIWMALFGGIVAVGLGKCLWGGLGDNPFNPALVGRAFLQAAFPGAMTTWRMPGEAFTSLPASTLAPPFASAGVDVVTTATPLARMKFDGELTEAGVLLLGDVAGSLGETSAALLLAGGLYLLWRRAFDWRIPASIFLSVGALAGILWLVNAERYPTPLFMWLSGGLMLGALYMATDPVTSPITPKGAWIFGAGIGVLVVLIRLFGGLPEGVMYAILLMNAGTPLIERSTASRIFGRDRKGQPAEGTS